LKSRREEVSRKDAKTPGERQEKVHTKAPRHEGRSQVRLVKAGFLAGISEASEFLGS
jgi:hypothetical protein